MKKMKLRPRRITVEDFDRLIDDQENRELLHKKLIEVYEEMVRTGEIPPHRGSTAILQKLSPIGG